MGVKTLGELRDRVELTLSLSAGSPYVDSVPELDDINEAYQATAYAYDWPSLLKRGGTVIVANKNRYSLLSNFRKFRYLFSEDVEYEEVEFDKLRFTTRGFAIDQNTSQFVLSYQPTSASTPYTTSNSETAGTAVVVELDTVTGLTAGEEIYINGTTPEFATIESVDTTAITITISFSNNITVGDKIYKRDEIIDQQFYRTVTLLSASGDTTLLPAAADYVMTHKAAAIMYERIEMFDEAKRQDDLWKERLAEVWMAFDKNTTGSSNQFSV